MKFKKSPQGLCKASAAAPDVKLIQTVLNQAKKRQRTKNLIMIARASWLQSVKAILPVDMPLANLCIMVKNGVLDRAFFSSTLTHVLKKENYYIQILNGSIQNMRSPKSK